MLRSSGTLLTHFCTLIHFKFISVKFPSPRYVLPDGGFIVETFYSFQFCASLLGSVVQVIGGRLADHLGHASSVRRAAWTDARLCRCRCRTRSAYGAVARAVCCTLAGNSFVSSAYFFAPPTPRRSCLLLSRVRREPMNRCMLSRFEIVYCQFREATG